MLTRQQFRELESEIGILPCRFGEGCILLGKHKDFYLCSKHRDGSTMFHAPNTKNQLQSFFDSLRFPVDFHVRVPSELEFETYFTSIVRMSRTYNQAATLIAQMHSEHQVEGTRFFQTAEQATFLLEIADISLIQRNPQGRMVLCNTLIRTCGQVWLLNRDLYNSTSVCYWEHFGNRPQSHQELVESLSKCAHLQKIWNNI